MSGQKPIELLEKDWKKVLEQPSNRNLKTSASAITLALHRVAVATHEYKEDKSAENAKNLRLSLAKLQPLCQTTLKAQSNVADVRDCLNHLMGSVKIQMATITKEIGEIEASDATHAQGASHSPSPSHLSGNGAQASTPGPKIGVSRPGPSAVASSGASANTPAPNGVGWRPGTVSGPVGSGPTIGASRTNPGISGSRPGTASGPGGGTPTHTPGPNNGGWRPGGVQGGTAQPGNAGPKIGATRTTQGTAPGGGAQLGTAGPGTVSSHSNSGDHAGPGASGSDMHSGAQTHGGGSSHSDGALAGEGAGASGHGGTFTRSQPGAQATGDHSRPGHGDEAMSREGMRQAEIERKIKEAEEDDDDGDAPPSYQEDAEKMKAARKKLREMQQQPGGTFDGVRG